MKQKFNLFILLSILCILIVTSGPFGQWVGQASKTIASVFESNFNYDIQRIRTKPSCAVALELLKYLPDNSTYSVTSDNAFAGYPYARATLNFFLYPIARYTDTDQADFEIFFSKNKITNTPNIFIYDLSDGVYLKSKTKLLPVPDRGLPYGLGRLNAINQFVRIFCGFFIWLLGSILTGKYIFSKLSSTKSNFFSIDWIGPEIITGSIILSIISWLLLLIGFSLKVSAIVSHIVIPSIFLLFLVLSKRSKTTITTNSPNMKNTFSVSVNEKYFGNTIIFGGVICFVSYIIYTFLCCEGTCDVFAHWLLKSKIFYVNSRFTYDSLDCHPIYPPLWPVMISMQYYFVNAVILELGRWTAGVLFISFLHAIWCFQRVLGHNTWYRAIACSIFMIWFTERTYALAYAESLLAATSFTCCLALLLYIKNNDNKTIILISILATSTFMAKLEGFTMALPLVFSVALYFVILRNYKKAFLVCLSAIPALLIFGFHLVHYFKVVEIDMIFRNVHLSKDISMTNIHMLIKEMLRLLAIYPIGGLYFFAAILISLIITKNKNLEIDHLTTILGIPILINLFFIPISMSKWPISYYHIDMITSVIKRLLQHSYVFILLLICHLLLLNDNRSRDGLIKFS